MSSELTPRAKKLLHMAKQHGDRGLVVVGIVELRDADALARAGYGALTLDDPEREIGTGGVGIFVARQEADGS